MVWEIASLLFATTGYSEHAQNQKGVFPTYNKAVEVANGGFIGLNIVVKIIKTTALFADGFVSGH